MRIAIVGGGISGLVSAYLLARRHEVVLFEAGETLGGHTSTVRVEEGDSKLPIDMGFIVFNDWTYPNFIRLLDELGVESAASDMSFSVRCERTGFEYNGSSLNQVFAQRRNLLRLSVYRMLFDIWRFNRSARGALGASPGLSLGEFLSREGFAGPVVDRYLVPMVAAIWSARPERMFDFPVRTLATFLHNHGMLSVDERPQWRFVRGGSQSYVRALVRVLGDRLRPGSPVTRVRRVTAGVEIDVGGGRATFDRVVLACHSPEALGLLADPGEAEREVLASIAYQPSEVVLHTDRSFLPRTPRAWASWNYHLNSPRAEGVQVTYYMNRLQRLESERPYCVTLNRTAEIDPEQIVARRIFAHPVYTAEAIAAQGRWGEISGVDSVHYCGAYWGYGFHEDGVRSAVRVAAQLGVEW